MQRCGWARNDWTGQVVGPSPGGGHSGSGLQRTAETERLGKVQNQQVEGKSNPLQYSCLESPVDRGAWWATVHGVAKSQTQLSTYTHTHRHTHTHTHTHTHMESPVYGWRPEARGCISSPAARGSRGEGSGGRHVEAMRGSRPGQRETRSLLQEGGDPEELGQGPVVGAGLAKVSVNSGGDGNRAAATGGSEQHA